MHLKPISRELRRKLYGRQKKYVLWVFFLNLDIQIVRFGKASLSDIPVTLSETWTEKIAFSKTGT